MSGRRRRAAMVLMRWSTLVLPDERRQWAEAMRAEIDAIDDDGKALDFAFGCLGMSAKERVCRADFFANALRVSIPFGLLALAVLAAYLSRRHEGGDTRAGDVFGILCVIFAAGAGLFVTKGAMALVRFAGILIPIYLALSLFLYTSPGSADDLSVADLYLALAIEGIAIWSALLLAALFVARLPAMHPSRSQERL